MSVSLFINNQWLSGSGAFFKSRNPASEEIVWQGNAASETDVNAAIHAASTAFPAWANLTLQDRIGYLEKFRTVITESTDALALTISKEMGKPLWDSKGEVTSIINKVPISIEAYQQRCPEITKPHPNGQLVIRHKPHGVIAILGPFNFPAHLPCGHIIPALLAGNTVVFKPSEYTPNVGILIAQCWEKCDLPPGVFNMVQGGHTVGQNLISHQSLNGLFFTGSWLAGKIFSEYFAKHPEKILALEMGGNNPLVIGEISELKTAATLTIQSAYLTSGQRCTCARRLIVPIGERGDAFLEELINQIMEIKVGPYTDIPEPYMGPVISEASAGHLLTVQETLRSQGGNSLVAMRLLKVDTALLSPGLIDVTHIPVRQDSEFFGPLLQVIRVADFDAAIEEANKTSYGLSAGLLSDKQEDYQKFYKEIRAGVINWNTPLTGASSAAPFGGIGHSGNHRPSAFYAADYCAYPVASLEGKMP